MTGSAPHAIVIGASAGALEALTAILTPLPEHYSMPIISVVHLPPHKESLLAHILNQKCRMNVREAEDKEPLLPGNIYFAPPDYHLLVEKNRTLSLSSEEEILYSRPSIDVLFETAADAYGENLIGIILTGANHDGAKGLKAVEQAGGTVIVQTPSEAFVSTMPQAALQICSNARALSLQEIALYLNQITRK